LCGADRPSLHLLKQIQRHCAELLPESVQRLAELVNIDTSPEHVDGLDQAIDLARRWWAGLGVTGEVLRTDAGQPLLWAERIVADRAPTVLILLHVDTVFPPGTAAQRPFHVQEGRATGPGVADMKGGVVTALMAVQAATEATSGLQGLNLRVLCTPDEEAGSIRSRTFIERSAEGAAVALVFEPGRPGGEIVTGRRGLRRYRITVHGRPAHTGVEPWSGANAIEELAHKIVAVQGLNDRDRFLSVTAAMVRGGSRINIVPDAASVDVDVRIPDLDTADRVADAIDALVQDCRVSGTVTEYEVLGERPPMTPGADALTCAGQMQVIARMLGADVDAITTGGGSDGAFVSRLGVPTVDGLGPVGGGYHTPQEFLTVDTIASRAAMTAGYLAMCSIRQLTARYGK
jgi:glutamate carboxypeptidase